jgi:hypothetical protein
MSAFVEAARTDEQRDLILGRLVDAVATFGNTGLLANDEDIMPSPKMTVETVLKNLSSPR